MIGKPETVWIKLKHVTETPDAFSGYTRENEFVKIPKTEVQSIMEDGMHKTFIVNKFFWKARKNIGKNPIITGEWSNDW